MPIISSVAFGIAMPVSRVNKIYPTKPTKSSNQVRGPRPIQVATDYSIRGLYKQNRVSRLHEQYRLYNRGSIPQTIGTLVTLNF
ncbi:MAG: hypothetical protein FWE02_03175 [Defluviitaleaceae bacterium]|nr:hypothetical protein [Defluviitaleaceae bacterium]